MSLDNRLLLLKEPKARNQEELLQEDLRIEDGDVGCPADQGVGRVGQGVDDIVAHQVTVFVLKHGQQDVLDHLGIHWTWPRNRESAAE